MLTVTFTVMIFSLVFTSCVSAKELTQFKENGYDEITTELIEQIIDNNNLDVTFNDAYLLVAYISSNNKNSYHLVFFNSKNMKNGVNYINSKNYFTFIGTDIFNVNTTSLLSNSVLDKSKDTWMFGLTYELPENLVYYSTIDVYDENHDVFFKGENYVPLEPSTTINKFVNFYNSFFTILGNFCKTIISKPLLLFPFSLAILFSIFFVFKSLL